MSIGTEEMLIRICLLDKKTRKKKKKKKEKEEEKILEMNDLFRLVVVWLDLFNLGVL